MSGISHEGRLAVHELLAEYSHHVDNYRGEEWGSLFLEDGKLISSSVVLAGPQAFVDKAKALLAGPKEYRHSITNIYLEPESTDERAVARAYGLITNWATKPAELAIFVEYRFQLVRHEGRWKIAQMDVHMPYADGQPRQSGPAATE